MRIGRLIDKKILRDTQYQINKTRKKIEASGDGWIKANPRLMSVSSCSSSMTSSLSSMNGSCLQQREAASSYPYMFHDPLHSLSSTYNHSRAAAVSAACNSAVAHQNSVNTHSSYGGVGSSSGGPSGTGTGTFFSKTKKIIKTKPFSKIKIFNFQV